MQHIAFLIFKNVCYNGTIKKMFFSEIGVAMCNIWRYVEIE